MFVKQATNGSRRALVELYRMPSRFGRLLFIWVKFRRKKSKAWTLLTTFYYDIDKTTGQVVYDDIIDGDYNDPIEVGRFRDIYKSDERKKRSFLERLRVANHPLLWALHGHHVLARSMLLKDDVEKEEVEREEGARVVGSLERSGRRKSHIILKYFLSALKSEHEILSWWADHSHAYELLQLVSIRLDLPSNSSLGCVRNTKIYTRLDVPAFNITSVVRASEWVPTAVTANDITEHSVDVHC
jgi:hypothetical protein